MEAAQPSKGVNPTGLSLSPLMRPLWRGDPYAHDGRLRTLKELCERKMQISGLLADIPIPWINQWYRISPQFAAHQFVSVLKIPGLMLSYGRSLLQNWKHLHDRVNNVFFRNLAGHFPLQMVFDVKRRFSVSAFVDTQYTLYFLACHMECYQHLKRAGRMQLEFREYLKEINFFNHISPRIQNELCIIVQQLFDEKAPALDPTKMKEELEGCFHLRIYSFTNIDLAFEDHKKILEQPGTLQKVGNIQSRMQEAGRMLMRQSLRLHLATVRTLATREANELPDHFVNLVREYVKLWTPLLIHSVELIHQLPSRNTKAKKNDEPNVLQVLPAHMKDQGISSLVSTLLSSFLRFVGLDNEIYYCVGLNPAQAPHFYHSFILVTDRVTGAKVLVDPVYKHYLPGCVSLPADVLVLNDTLVEGWRRGLMAKASSGQHDTLTKLWNFNDYQKVTRNAMQASLFSIQEELKPQFHELLKTLGLDDVLINNNQKQIRIMAASAYQVGMLERRDTPENLKLELLQNLERIDSNAVTSCAFMLDLDQRMLVVLKTEAIGYYMEMCKQVNPHHRPATAIYGMGSSDVSSALLAMDPTTLVMLNPRPFDLKKIRLYADKGMRDRASLEEANKMNLKAYFDHKRLVGGYNVLNLSLRNLELCLMVELEKLGIDTANIHIEEAPEFKGFRLKFDWQYRSQEKKEYHVIFSECQLTIPATYPKGLNQLLEGGIDFFFMKAAGEVPVTYDKWLSRFVVKPGGFMLTSDRVIGTPLQCNYGAMEGEFEKIPDSRLAQQYLRMMDVPFKDWNRSNMLPYCHHDVLRMMSAVNIRQRK